MNHDLAHFGVEIPEILLPNKSVDLKKWAVVACDQYTSQPDYWEQVSRAAGDSPSTLRLILPEIYLGSVNEAEKVRQIQQRMRDYLQNGVLQRLGPGFIYVERITHPGIRRGLMVALDLEHYDFRPGSQTYIRATEGTVLERIPPRVRIREGAALEVPHIMVLIDDPDCRVIEPLAGRTKELTEVYRTELMMGGGRVTGYLVNDHQSLRNITDGLRLLADPERFDKKYGISGRPLLLFAVGDGNHSLATAKVVWEKLKANSGSSPILVNRDYHPARYALVELVNIHDPGLVFEPIHRVLFNIHQEEFQQALKTYYASQNLPLTIDYYQELQTMNQKTAILRKANPKEHYLEFVTENGFGLITIQRPNCNLAVGTLQAFIDVFAKNNPLVKIDYIHGVPVVTELGSKQGNIGFYLPPMNKTDLFTTVILDGVLPRKTFSMGEAEDKRFYMECRRIAGE
jgi:uncharacterized protein (DUF1015 family)